MIDAHFSSEDGARLVLVGDESPPRQAELIGPRARIVGHPESAAAGWKIEIPLEASRWGGPMLPLPSGKYRIVVEGLHDDIAPVPITQLGTLRAEIHDGMLRVGPPLHPAYDSGEGQDALERRYATRPTILENAVFFESFYGRNASCNPLAIDRELARRAPEVMRYWSVVDLSVAVPEGAIAVVEGSPEWWRARGEARLLVINDWLRRRFARRRGQRVLQTWHGSPLKRLALHRPGFDPRRAVAVVREGRRWDALLAQNAYSERVLCKAYAYLRRPIWVEGYPRNDVLVTGDGARTRELLGLSESDRVLLYAPTWRDDRDEIVDFIDLDQLAVDTDSVVLVRGHSRTILGGADAHGPRVIDVTTFPDIAQLLLVADALVTDYSSVMFDFSVTGKPMYFFVPDLVHYRGELRGFYFDLEQHAPGPVVRTADELTDALNAGESEAYAERYKRWRARFNSRDDGRASERVVARILDQGWIDRT